MRKSLASKSSYQIVNELIRNNIQIAKQISAYSNSFNYIPLPEKSLICDNIQYFSIDWFFKVILLSISLSKSPHYISIHKLAMELWSYIIINEGFSLLDLFSLISKNSVLIPPFRNRIARIYKWVTLKQFSLSIC